MEIQMKRNAMITGLLLSLPVAFLQAQTTNMPQQKGDSGDATFVEKAGAGGMAEVELSNIAESNAKSPEVKKFAMQMVHDHTANNKNLATIAAKENISLPKTLDAEHAALRDKLKAETGADFDRDYVAAMRSDHQNMLDLLKSSESTVSTEELRTFIKKTQPVVEHHLSMAQNLKAE
jgi:putative membrane protein